MAQYRIDSQQYLNDGTTIFEVVMLGDKDGNIINTFGAASNIPISANNVAGYAPIHKFGQVTGNDGTPCTIWTEAGTTSTSYELYPWDTAAGTVSVVSTSTQDAAAGSGALTIRVEGLDTSYNFLSEDFTMLGQTETAEGSETFLRVNRAYVLTGNTNVGKIDIKNGSVIVGQIAAGYGQTLMALYTIPAGKTGYLSRVRTSSAKQQTAVVGLMVRPFGGAFRAQSTLSLYSGDGSTIFDSPLRITEKSDIDARLLDGASNNTLSVDFDLILVDNA